MPLLIWTVMAMYPWTTKAQIGVQGGWWQPSSLAESAKAPTPLIENGWHVSISYGLRNRNMRLELHPSIGLLMTRAKDPLEKDLGGTGIIAAADARIYPMDLYGDCMCPTFHRNGDVFKKGFFWEAGAGYTSLNQDIGGLNFRGDIFLARAGMGLDIGLTRRLTFTPGLRLQYAHRFHSWGASAEEQSFRPIWLLPYLQLTTYLRD